MKALALLVLAVAACSKTAEPTPTACDELWYAHYVEWKAAKQVRPKALQDREDTNTARALSNAKILVRNALPKEDFLPVCEALTGPPAGCEGLDYWQLPACVEFLDRLDVAVEDAR